MGRAEEFENYLQVMQAIPSAHLQSGNRWKSQLPAEGGLQTCDDRSIIDR